MLLKGNSKSYWFAWRPVRVAVSNSEYEIWWLEKVVRRITHVRCWGRCVYYYDPGYIDLELPKGSE